MNHEPIEFTSDASYFALIENGEAVVLVRDSVLVWHDPDSENIGRWLIPENRSISILNEAEYGTYHAICDLEQIHISKFTEWAIRYDGNSNTNRKKPDSRNPIRKLWKSIQNFR